MDEKHQHIAEMGFLRILGIEYRATKRYTDQLAVGLPSDSTTNRVGVLGRED